MAKKIIGAGKWKAKVLFCGDHSTYKANLTIEHDPDLYIKLPYLAFLLTDGEMNVLIDNGMNDRFIIDGKAWANCPCNSGAQYFLDSLAKEGLKPDDIDLILYTHLHNDHAGNCNFFPKTKSIAQYDEWQNLLDPNFSERRRRDYDLDVIPYLHNNPNFYKIDGDAEILEGIKLIKTPGHTRGSQCIVANTVNGVRIFVGDQFHMGCSFYPWLEEMPDVDGVSHKITAEHEWPTIPSSLIYDYPSYYKSVEKVRAYVPDITDTQYVMCGHDPALLFREI
ncbi:N-acyl homoserine lactonase family protein [Anaerotruncus rubiinfantis]|uniref:N-acyl homoserine lactonase family protein n=1 Tax=Anaerotruncus rubiinfantis TaxID=1720200 RepID=UPI0008312241|nr:N-acyl homoserine lactonase family protein [Anaerotruncus rubiinfantis]